MIRVLLDTNAYLRLARRVQPMLGVEFGPKAYVLTVLRDVEEEVHRSARLKQKYPWFDQQPLAEERLASRLKLSGQERESIEAATSVLRAAVLEDPSRFLTRRGSPPSEVDCRVLAYGVVLKCLVVTDDLSMHMLAVEHDIKVWHGFDLLKALLNARRVDTVLIREIFEALENNDDLPATWKEARHTKFQKIFGKPQSK